MNLSIKSVKSTLHLVHSKNLSTGNKFLDARYEDQKKFSAGSAIKYYRLFYRLAEKLKPKLVVELGAFQATGGAHFAGGNPDGEVVTIDIHKDPGQDLDELKCHEAERHFPNLTHIKGWTWDDHVVEAVKSYNTPIDILYIDAWHRYDYVQREWGIYSKLLADKALIICDDILDNDGLFEDMEKWWDEVKYPKFLDDKMHNGIPMGFFVYSRKGNIKNAK